MKGYFSLCAWGVLLSSLAAQSTPTADVEARLATLEDKAARAEALEREVLELRSRVANYEVLAENEALERHVARIVEDRRVAGAVEAVRSERIRIGGQVRLRGDFRTVSSYANADPRSTEEDLVFQRTRVDFDAQILENLRAFVQVQDSRAWGEEMSVLRDLEGVDLHQGFVEFQNVAETGLSVRAGRFALSLWNQRLISPLDWDPVSRSFDGVLVFGALSEDFMLHAGWHALVEDARLDDDKDDDLYWTALTYSGIENHELGIAFFWIDADSVSSASISTLTLHGSGARGGFDYSADGVLQFGKTESSDIEAHALALTLGYTFEGDAKFRLGLEWTFATGDDASTNDNETFFPLFTFGHAYQGLLDIFSWRNGHDFVVHLSMKPSEDWWIGLDLHAFRLDTTDDAWYAANLVPLRLAPGSSSKDVGYEVDVHAKVQVNPSLHLWFGYSHFFAGDFVEESGAAPDMHWLFVQLTVDF